MAAKWCMLICRTRVLKANYMANMDSIATMKVRVDLREHGVLYNHRCLRDERVQSFSCFIIFGDDRNCCIHSSAFVLFSRYEYLLPTSFVNVAFV